MTREEKKGEERRDRKEKRGVRSGETKKERRGEDGRREERGRESRGRENLSSFKPPLARRTSVVTTINARSAAPGALQ